MCELTIAGVAIMLGLLPYLQIDNWYAPIVREWLGLYGSGQALAWAAAFCVPAVMLTAGVFARIAPLRNAALMAFSGMSGLLGVMLITLEALPFVAGVTLVISMASIGMLRLEARTGPTLQDYIVMRLRQ